MKRIVLLCCFVLVACGPTRMQHPRSDTAVMVFYGGKGPAVLLIVDGFPADSLPFGKVARFTVAPGEHTFWAKSEGLFGPPVTLRLAPGEISYFAYVVTGRSFERLDEQQFNRRAVADAE
jgi:hypothetical protein